jgi:hypothetical protein
MESLHLGTSTSIADKSCTSLKLPRSWTEANRVGAPRFFSGKPCKNGHVAEKYTKSGNCCKCSELRNASPEIVEYMRAHGVRRRATMTPEQRAEKAAYMRGYHARRAQRERAPV